MTGILKHFDDSSFENLDTKGCLPLSRISHPFVSFHSHTRTHAHTHARTHARSLARSHAHTHARTHARTHTHTHTHTFWYMTLNILFDTWPAHYTALVSICACLLCKMYSRMWVGACYCTVTALFCRVENVGAQRAWDRRERGLQDLIIINNNHIQRRYSRFFTISSQRCELSPTRMLKWPGRNRVHITCNTSSAYHVQVSCYVPLSTKGELSD